MSSNEMLDRAITLAVAAHAGQTDRAGQPYILHPLRVMLAVEHPDERIVAVLHDVVEDSAITLDDLAKVGFSATVIEAIDSVTKREGESYPQFVARAGQNMIGRTVKLADLRDNSDLNRIGQQNMTEADWDRHLKYTKAIEQLLSASA